MKNFKIIKKINTEIILFKISCFSDPRGNFFKLFSFEDLGKYFEGKIKQINLVKNKKKGVFRGFHYQTKKYAEQKLVTCLKGKVEVIIVNCKKNSKNYLKNYKFILSEKKKNFLLVPKNYAHGYFVIEDKSEVLYFSNKDYKLSHEKIINPYDPILKINWKKKLILSDKDRIAKYL